MQREMAHARVLMAPLHYSTGADVGGSEMQWAYEIATGVARRVESVDAVVGRWRNGDVPPNLTVHEVGLSTAANYFSDAHLLHRLRFIGAYAKACRSIIQRHAPDVFHHVLPFGPETFNPIILSRSVSLPRGRTRVIIGPVQNAHQTTFKSEDTFNRFNDAAHRETPAMRIQRFMYRRFGVGARQLCAATLNRADCVIAVTKAAKRMLEGLGCRRPIEVIPSGTTPERYEVPDRTNRRGPLRIIVANYLVQRKGCDVILNALAIARERGADFICDIAGDGPERDALTQQINKLRLGHCVRMLGMKNADDLAKLYAAADLFVSMSYAEGLPTALMEAMSAGLPLISADNDGALELIRPNVNGSIVPRGDAVALAQAIEWYSMNSAPRLEQGANARKIAMAAYNWNVICDQYIDLYLDLMTSKKESA